MSGKISRTFFENNIINRIGKIRNEVVIPPKNGVDVGIIKLADSYMAVTTDPLYIDISFGLRRAAWFAMHILLSDLYTAGIEAQYMSIDLNLPESLSDNDFNIIWGVINEECVKFNIEIVTGHTARYAGTGFPMVGGVTLMGVGKKYITTENAKPGDKIIMVRSCGLEASIILANTFPEYVKERLGSDAHKRIDSMFYDMSCVNIEKLAIEYGIGSKITSMHDATEGGLLNSIYEIGTASGNGIIIDFDKIIIDPDIKSICNLFEINPLRSISEGTLLLTVKKEYTDGFIALIESNGLKCSVIGDVLDRSSGIKIDENGKTVDILPEDDQIWAALKHGVGR
ncbi:MAG: AIR synthase family protein [Ferroplasma sp.]